MKEFKIVNITDGARTELHDLLNLTGAEVSINVLPAGTSVPFVHSHKENEEIYAILEGEGYALINGKTVALNTGDWVRISPSAKRQFFASAEKSLKYICIQVKANSLGGYTITDAVV